MDKSKNYFPKNITNDSEIFANSWLYNIPLDLSSSYDSLKNKEIYNEKNNNLEKYLPKNLINTLFEDDSETKKAESFSKTLFNYKNIKHNLEKKKEIVTNNNFNSFNNYNINIYKPNINFINIYYPFTSNLESNITSDNNSQQKYITNSYINRNTNINSKYINQNLINKNVNYNIGNTISFVNNNDISVNYSKEKIKNQAKNNIINKNPANESINEQAKTKRQKKKRKKKVNDEFTVEVLGRRGWICENCTNFNYESRKSCNRCKLVKTAISKSILFGKDSSKILNNLINGNNKKEWNCRLCGNVNYSFRIICNRCQNPKDVENENKVKDIIN